MLCPNMLYVFFYSADVRSPLFRCFSDSKREEQTKKKQNPKQTKKVENRAKGFYMYRWPRSFRFSTWSSLVIPRDTVRTQFFRGSTESHKFILVLSPPPPPPTLYFSRNRRWRKKDTKKFARRHTLLSWRFAINS